MSGHNDNDCSFAKTAGAEDEPNRSTIVSPDVSKNAVTTDIRSSPPSLGNSKTSADFTSLVDNVVDFDNAGGDSEAETIVLTGADRSPHKKRNPIKHEDKGHYERLEDVPEKINNDAAPRNEESSDSEREGQPTITGLGKRKRGNHDSPKDVVPGSGHTSGLSSASPHSLKDLDPVSNHPLPSPLQVPSKDKAGRNPRKRKLTEDSVSTAEGGSHRKSRHRPNSEASTAASRDRRDTRSITHGSNQRTSHERSLSPQFRSHKRAVSGQSALPQLPNGHSHKKRKIPPPLTTAKGTRSSEDSESDSSSASGSAQRRPQLKKLASADNSIMSPAKMPHKKHRDSSGRTFLARACANAEVENVRARLHERPEDIDVADNAKNTPLQIASLAGSTEIVQILIEAGCDINCKNDEKDTPLIDAVENGHLEVVRLLLDAGANPRQRNVKGAAAFDLLKSDGYNYEAIKSALTTAKNNNGHRRQSEDHHMHTAAAMKENGRSSRGASAASPRDSPPMGIPRSPPVASLSRRRTGRSEPTRNDFLWMSATPENLRDRAGKGDIAGVAHILNQVPKADTESLIAAARGGHDEVIQLLLGIGEADADPDPLLSQIFNPGYNTPMLAAIGCGNEKVLQLLLDQPNFDPTRRTYKGLAYFEIAKERQNFNWEREYEILKEAFDSYIGRGTEGRIGASSTAPASSSSPRRPQSKGKGAKQHMRASSSSPTRFNTEKKFLRGETSSGRETGTPSLKRDKIQKEARRDKPNKSHNSPKVNLEGTDRGKNSPGILSDQERLSLDSPKRRASVKRRKSDAGVVTSKGEAAKPRRKLVSRKVLRTDKERKQRNSTNFSSSSSSSGTDEPINLGPATEYTKEPLKPSNTALPRKPEGKKTAVPRLKDSTSESDSTDGNVLTSKEKSKPEPSRERRSTVREEAKSKASRTSVSPQMSKAHEMEVHVAHGNRDKTKNMRLEPGNEPAQRTELTRQPKHGPARVANMDRSAELNEQRNGTVSDPVALSDAKIPDTDRFTSIANSSVDADAFKPEASNGEHDAQERHQLYDGTTNQGNKADETNKFAEPGQVPFRNREEEARKRIQEEVDRRLEEEKKEQEHFRRKQEEETRLLQEAEEKRWADDKAERERQAQAEKEEYERKERIAREEEEVRLEQKRKVKEAEQRELIAREEEEARIEKRRLEDEIQKRRLEQERQRREEQERRQVEREALERQQEIQRREEQERNRLKSLPNSLRRAAELDITEAKTPSEARRWLPLYCVPTSELDPDCVDVAKETWITNVQAAPILGIKDLQLSQYTAWEKRPLTDRDRVCIYRLIRRKLAEDITSTPLTNTSYKSVMETDVEIEGKFLAMDHVFWIKLSDFKDIIPRYPHLQGLAMCSRETVLD